MTLSLFILAYLCISHIFFVRLVLLGRNSFKWSLIKCYFWPGILLKPIMSKVYDFLAKISDFIQDITLFSLPKT